MIVVKKKEDFGAIPALVSDQAAARLDASRVDPGEGAWTYVVEPGDEWWFGGRNCAQIVIRPAAGSEWESLAVMGCNSPPTDEELARARLIAAAPELLKYLEIALGVIAASKIIWMGADDARAAITKAKAA